MFRKDRMGRRGGGVLLGIKDTIPAYEVQFQEEADCNEAIWCCHGITQGQLGVVDDLVSPEEWWASSLAAP